MTNSMLSRRQFVTGIVGTSSLLLYGCTADGGASLADRSKGAGLGFDLWAGVPGVQFGQPVNKVQGSRRITGPIRWKHPITGESIQIYKRTNIEDNGAKLQYFSKRPDGTALARVFDRRPGQADRYFVNDAFVPIGTWRGGQSRNYVMTEYQNGRSSKRRLTIKVRNADYTYHGIRHSMTYDWISRGANGRVIFKERFIFSPGIGFVDFDNLLN